MRAKKSLGQHFLKSERALKAMINAAQIKNNDTVLEIGPGMGALTEKLIETGAKIISVEKDDELFEFLKKKFKNDISSGKLTLIHDDILNFQPENFGLQASCWKIVANIPYNITGLIFPKFLQSNNQPERMILLVQKEVAKRISDVKNSILSISVKSYGTPEYIETVKAGSFVPMPNVDSAIISIENISKSFFQEIAHHVNTECLQVEGKFFEMVRAGFKSKRKKLSSNLASIFGKQNIKKAFEKMGLDENIRAEDLKIDDWKNIAKELLIK